MSDIRDIAVKFEAVKVSMTQDKNGFNLRLCVHPDDVPDDLFRDWVGTRYGVAMVRINDHEEPDISPDQLERKRLVKSAIMCCKEPEFWEVLQTQSKPLGTLKIKSEEDCTIALKGYLNIGSRNELEHNELAQSKFKSLRAKYMESKR
jgi:hypothetical protein